MQIINLDLQKKDGFNKAITARRGESGWQFGVRLFDGGLQYATTSGDKFAFKVTTPSGNYARVDCTYANGMVTVPLNSQITSEAGYYRKAYIEITNGSKIRTTQDIIFFSLGNSDISAGHAHYYVSELDKLLKQLNEEFDEWLKEREKDYTDLLARITALANRMTGLETKLDDIIAQLQKVEINTKNVFQQSRFSKPETEVRRRLSNNMFEFNGWALGIVDNANTLQMLEPNKTYHTHYIAELMTLTGGELYPVQGNAGFALYSGVDNAKYPTIWIGEGKTVDFRDVKVGDKIERSTTFTTPANLRDSAANYRIIGYSRRDTQGVTDRVRIHDMIIQEGSMWTGFQPAADDSLTKYDEQMYVKSVLSDPNMTAINPPTIENGSDGNPTMHVRYTAAGEMVLKTLVTTGRARVYWSAAQLGLSVDEMKQPFNIKFNMRHNGTAGTRTNVEIGYSGQTGNPIFAIGSVMDTYVATIQSTANAALCIYLEAGVEIVIKETYVYPANTDITSKRIENIEAVTTAPLEQRASQNADTYTTSGQWAISGDNLPLGDTTYYFYLRVYAFSADGSNVLQLATRQTGNTVNNRTWVRQRINGTWGRWESFIQNGALADDMTAYYDGDPNQILTTQRVLLNIGRNAPLQAAALVETVFLSASSGYQEVHYITSGKSYHRFYSNSTWREWRQTPELFADGRVDTKAVDFNTLTETETIINTSATNSPDGATSTSWYTEVIRYGSSGNYVLQRATKISNTYRETYQRQLFNGAWTQWDAVYVPYIGQRLGTASDANKINYTCTMQLEGTAASNLPVTGSGIYYYLETIARAGNYIMQRATMRGTADRTWTRQSNNGVWTEWLEVLKDTNSLPRVEITDFKTGWGHYSSNSRLTVRKVNGMVSLDGVFTNTVEMATGGDGTDRVVATLPEGYRPDTTITGMRMNGSGTTSWLLSIKPNGDICYSRHTDSGGSGWVGKQTTGKWFATHAVFPSA